MSLLVDKFNILENNTTLGDDKLLSIIDNYFENLLNTEEKVIHSDFIYQIFWFNKNLDFSNLVLKHLENFLKQRKIVIRNNIKKGIFEMDNLIKLIRNYNEKTSKISLLCTDKDKILKLSSNYLFELIISDPSVINFIKSELENIYNDKKKYIIELFKSIEIISELNPQLKIYKWFLLLIASSLDENIDDIIKKTYPVPEYYQVMINFTSICKVYENVVHHYSFVKESINIILSTSLYNFTNFIVKIFNTCNIKQINTIIKNNKLILEKIYTDNNIIYNDLVIRDFLTKEYLLFVNNKFFAIVDNEINISLLMNFANCWKLCENLINNSNGAKDIINKKVTSYFSNDKIIDLIINNIHENILNEKDYENIINILYLTSNIKEKDKFIDKYNRKLIERLLYKPNIKKEKELLDILITKFDEKLINKTTKIITDINHSIGAYNNFKLIKIDKLDLKDKFNIVTTSYNSFDSNTHEGILEFTNFENNKYESKLIDILTVYSIFYKQRYENKRKLNVYPHFGEIIFDFMGKEFKMMPLQYLVLEYIYKHPNISKNDILDCQLLSTYNDNFKQSILNSLIFGGIIKIKKMSILELTNNINDVSFDFIHIFFTTTNYGTIWEEKRQEELMMTRDDILSANINHFVKVNKMNKDDLFKIISNKMNIFTLENEFFENVLQMMINKDYISIKDNIVEKLLW